VISLNILVSCAQPPDVAICTKITDEKGWCTNTISDKEFYVNGEEWKKLDSESLRVPAASWAQIKAFILKSCKKSGECNKNLTTWERKTSSVDEKIKK